jgi:DNA-directed RNA polymerase subunit E'/Rpb7
VVEKTLITHSTKDQFTSNAHINAQIESRLATNNKKRNKENRGKMKEREKPHLGCYQQNNVKEER